MQVEEEVPTAASIVAGDPAPTNGTAASTSAAAPAEGAAAVEPWFADWANENGVQEFAQLLTHAGLSAFVESCEAALTIFVPTNEAIRALAHTLPTDTQLLRELLCVHITMGSLRYGVTPPS